MSNSKKYKYLIVFSYDGSRFNGFQRLKDANSIQGEIERVLSIINKEKTYIRGAGRTDRGAHAYGQTAHFELNNFIEPLSLIKVINNYINKFIVINECYIVNDEFHARFDAKQKTYIYKINVGKANPLYQSYMYQINKQLDYKKMKKCCKLFVGAHDFEYFVSGKRFNDNYDSIIKKVKITKKNNIITIKFVGKSFYTYMIRNLVGAIVNVGLSKTDIKTVKDILDKKIDKRLPTAPPQGLYLLKIKY